MNPSSGIFLPERESIAEDVLLLALHDERGTTSLHEKRLRAALAAATAMDLLVSGKIATMDGHVIVTDRTPTNDPARDYALHAIGTATTRMPLSRCGDLIAAAMPDIMPRLCDQLVARGVVERHPHRILSVIPATDRYPARDGRMEQNLRNRIREVALHGKEPDTRTAILAAFVVGYHLETGLFNDDERPVAVARLREIAGQLHQRSRSDPPAATGIIANASVAGETQGGDNAFADLVVDEGVGMAMEFIFNLLPTLLGGLLELLDG